MFYAGKEGTVSEWKLKDTTDIFNARCKTDFNKLKRYANANQIPLNCDTLERLRDEDWTYVFEDDKRRQYYIDVVSKLGYDGFFNYEWIEPMKEIIRKDILLVTSPSTDDNPAIGVLKKDAFSLVRTYDYGKLLTFDIVQNCEPEEKKKVISEYWRLVQEYGKGVAHDLSFKKVNIWISLTEEEVIAILSEENSKVPLKEEQQRILRFLKGTHRPGCKEAAIKLEERLMKNGKSMTLKELCEKVKKSKKYVNILAGQFGLYNIQPVVDFIYDHKDNVYTLMCSYDENLVPIKMTELFSENYKHPYATIEVLEEDTNYIMPVLSTQILDDTHIWGDDTVIVLQ